MLRHYLSMSSFGTILGLGDGYAYSVQHKRVLLPDLAGIVSELRAKHNQCQRAQISTSFWTTSVLSGNYPKADVPIPNAPSRQLVPNQ